MNEYFVGIDLHRNYFTYFASDAKGNEVAKGKLLNSTESVDSLISSFPKQAVIKVVVEATRNWMWLTSLLTQEGCDVKLAHPFKTKAIASARIKTDSIDAKTLCHLLRANLIPESYIASADEQDNRELSRGRIALVHDQTLTKNRIHAILGKDNLNFSGSDLFGKAGRQWLDNQILSESKRKMVDIHLERLDSIRGSIKQVDSLIKQKGGSDPRVKLLNTIPGIGNTTSFLLVSEIGDIERFPNSKCFASYFGLVPRLSQSGGHAYYGRITKLGNPYVRWTLVQAAHRLARTDPEYKRFVDRLNYRGGKKKAIVALARKLSTIVYCVLKHQRQYISDYAKALKVGPVILPEGKEQSFAIV